MKSEKQIHIIALSCTIIIHFCLLLVPIQSKIKIKKETPSIQPIPINYIVKETIIERPKPSPPPKAIPKKIPKKATPKPVQPPQPTSLPGDREFASVSKSHTPYYPKTAINNLYEGTTILNVTINEYGDIVVIEVKKSSGHPSLDQAFIDSVTNFYQFKPKRVMGQNKPDTIVLKYTFEL